MVGRGAASTRKLHCHGLFYDRELVSGGGIQRCRSQLVLEFCDTGPNGRTLLLFLMNPGASYPRADAEIIRTVTRACQIPRRAVWLPTIPDATQAQTVLLMDALECCRAIVVNLSDVCEVDSNALCSRVNALTNNTPPWDSLFHVERDAELRKLQANGPYEATIGGWGTLSPKQKCLRDAAVKARTRFQNIVGKPPKRSFENLGRCHPRPTANGGPRPNYYVDWRQKVASELNLPQRIKTALGAKRRIDGLVDKDHIWTPVGSDTLSIDLRK